MKNYFFIDELRYRRNIFGCERIKKLCFPRRMIFDGRKTSFQQTFIAW